MKSRPTTKRIATETARAEQLQQRSDAEKAQRDRDRTNGERTRLQLRALNIRTLADEMHDVIGAADVIDTRRLAEELERIEANLTRQVERTAEDAGLVASYAPVSGNPTS